MSIIAGLSKDTVESSQIFKSGIFDFFTMASAYAFMVFNLFSAPCFGAIGAMKKELGGIKKTLRVIIFQIALAWFLATLVYQIGSRIENKTFRLSDMLVTVAIFTIAYFILKSKINKNNKCNRCPYYRDCEKYVKNKSEILTN